MFVGRLGSTLVLSYVLYFVFFHVKYDGVGRVCQEGYSEKKQDEFEIVRMGLPLMFYSFIYLLDHLGHLMFLLGRHS